jgi:guanylate kinase
MEKEPNLIFSISYTTRAPRGQEQDGHEYHFVSREHFLAMRERDEFVEWAPVFDDFYGTHRRYLDQGKAESRDVVLDIDVKGARQLRERIPEAVSVFILAPSREELVKRLCARGDVPDQVIRKRVAEAVREIQNFGQYDYVLVNDSVEAASDQLWSIVKAARIQRKNPDVKARVEQILGTFDEQI